MFAIEKSAITSMATEWGLANVSANDFIQDEQSHIIYACLSRAENDEEHLLWLALNTAVLAITILPEKNIFHYTERNN